MTQEAQHCAAWRASEHLWTVGLGIYERPDGVHYAQPVRCEQGRAENHNPREAQHRSHRVLRHPEELPQPLRQVCGLSDAPQCPVRKYTQGAASSNVI